jgi:thymidylate kinase
MNILKIALTGGPCGGKTTSIEKIEEEFSEKGYNILIVPEAATILINSGIRPFGNNKLTMYDFQKYVMSLQMYLEDMAISCAKSSNKNTIILCDRGLMDDKAYVSDEEFTRLLKEVNLTTFDLMNRYDLVIHLKTAALGKEEFYTLSNNSARTETVEEAREKDFKTLNSWIGHDNLKIIGNKTDFNTKIQKVINEINYMLSSTYPIQRQEKYLVECDLLKLLELNPVIHSIEQYVITKDNIESIYRKTIRGNEVKYSKINKIDTNINNERITTRRSISEREYLDNLEIDNVPLKKTRYSFQYNDQYFRLDVFSDNLQILEIEDSNITKERLFPIFITSIEDISNNKLYRNKALYLELNKNKEYVKK